ncbi:hypothetical protein LTR27_005425 [Elasticomyces elasticus]|nr:hypothetical protein LTR27_005425 [Elasticomyces elasticus]
MLTTLSVLVALAVMLGAATALPEPEPEMFRRATCVSSKPKFDFDDLKAQVSNNPLNPIPDPHNGLTFQSFTFNTIDPLNLPVGKSAIPYLIPDSGKNVIATGVLTEITKGSPQITCENNFHKVSQFTLTAFAFGCVNNVGIPTSCQFTLTAYQSLYMSDTPNKKLGSETFTYLPNGKTGLSPGAAHMTTTHSENFGADFSYATRIEISNINSGTGSILSGAMAPLIVVVLDSMDMTLYDCTGSAAT